MPVAPKLAASVLLVRESPAGTDALLVRKHARLAFAGGDFVFPGGKVESCDLLPDDLYHPMPEARGDGSLRRAHIGALCREAFEEIGVLLARDRQGNHCSGLAVDALDSYRGEIHKDPSLFARLLRANGLAVHEQDFVHWANWITPSAWSKRFDTHFYVAAMPGEQAVKCDTAEATELTWLDIGAFNAREATSIVPSEPTLYSLADLAARYRECGSLDRMFRRERNRPIPRIMQKMVERENGMVVLAPWDSGYDAAPGEGVDLEGIPDFYRALPARSWWDA